MTYVSSQLGHANPHLTMKVYAHWVPHESQREAVNRLPSLMRSSTGMDTSQVIARSKKFTLNPQPGRNQVGAERFRVRMESLITYYFCVG